jgi:hypothetical protein
MPQAVKIAASIPVRQEEVAAILSSADCVSLMKFSASISMAKYGTRSIPHMAEGMKLTDDWRKVAEQLVDKIERIIDPSLCAFERGQKFKVLSKMLLVAPTADRSDEGTVAKVSAYLDDALDDLPAWAVAAAVRRWHRMECGSAYNYNFAPAPGVLRTIVLEHLEPAKLALLRLKLVLSAAPSVAEAEKIASGSIAQLVPRPIGD